MGRHSANRGDKERRIRGRAENRPNNRRNSEVENLSHADVQVKKHGKLESAPKSLRSELERRKSRNKRVAASIALGVLALLVVLAAGGLWYYKSLENQLQKGIVTKKKLDIKTKKAEPKTPYNMLIMGYDKREGETSYRSDLMMLARIDPVEKKVWLISLPRDYKVQIPGHGTRKLNAAYAFGQEKLAISTVEKLTGQTINHYMGVNFEGFEAIVNAVGGVEINVPNKIDTGAGGYASKIDAGVQVLDGAQALTFVRSRNYPDADVTRMKNQQLFFMALADTVAKNVSTSELPGVAKAVVPYLSTSMSLVELYGMANDLRGAGSGNIYTASLPGVWKSPFLVPDEAGMAEVIRKFSEGIPFNMTAEEEALLHNKGVKPEDVSITVRNGTSRVGVAKQAAAVLKTRGFNVGEVGNTQNQSVYDETLVIYKTSKESAELTLKYLQPGVKVVESRGMYTYDTEVMLIIGKNWDIEKLPVVDVSE